MESYRSRVKKVLSALSGLSFIFLLVLLWTVLAPVPPVTIPTPAPPRVNAYNFYAQAGAAMVGVDDVRDAIATRPLAHAYTPAEKADLLAQNQAALRTARQGFAYPYLQPPSRSWSVVAQPYDKFRYLARLFVLDAQIKAAHGDWAGAMSSDLDAIQLGRDATHGAPLTGFFFGLGCEAIGRRDGWGVLPHLDARQAHATLTRLSGLEARRVPYSQVLREEEWLGQAEMIKQMRAFQKISSMGAVALSAPATWRALPHTLLRGRGAALADYTRCMNAAVANAKLAFDRRRPDPVPETIFGKMVFMGRFGSAFSDACSRAADALFVTALALHAYHQEYDAFPGSLGRLTPGYLPHPLEDPFSPGNMLRYRLRDDKYELYSIGPDGHDDGGRPVDNPHIPGVKKPTFFARHRVTIDSTGDMVAGINNGG